MKAYYLCSAEAITNLGWRVFRPALATAVDSLNGHWKPCWQNSDTHPTLFVVVVSDRRDLSLPRNLGVHTAALAASRRRFTDVEDARRFASTLLDQEVGGE